MWGNKLLEIATWGRLTRRLYSAQGIVITVREMNNPKTRWTVYTILMILAVIGMSVARPTAAKQPEGGTVEYSCTLAGQNGQNVHWVMNKGNKTGQDDVPRGSMPEEAWNALQDLKTGSNADREMYERIVQSECNAANDALGEDSDVTPTSTVVVTETALPGATATATALPTVTPPPGGDPNKNKDCVWDGDATKGHWNCGGTPAVPHPSATPTLVIGSTPVPTDAATLAPTEASAATEEPASVVITDGDQIPGGSEDSTAAEEGKKEYVCDPPDKHGNIKCHWEPVKTDATP